jgi:putative phosphoesterase
MRAALIGDVHANLPALEAVLTHAQDHGIDAVWNIGDFVGYGAFPDEVVTVLRGLGAISIQGNYDRKVLKVKKKRKQWQQEKTPEKWLAFEWAYTHLSKDNRRYLRDLPEQIRLDRDGHAVLLVHGSPASQDEHLTLETPVERLAELAAIAGTEIVVCGHSHQPFTRYANETWFINTGSVGRPDDGDPRAAYAILDLKPGTCEAIHYRVEYDVEREASAICAMGLPEDFARMARQGRSLDAIQGGKQSGIL